MAKNAILSRIWPYKKAETQNIKKSLFEVLEGTLRNISTRNWVNWTFFEKMHNVPSKICSPNFCPSAKKWVSFCPKIGQFLVKIYKILEINKNHLNTQYVQNIGHLKHFWPKNCNFFPFLGHFLPFPPLLFYKGKCWLVVICPCALAAITFEQVVRFKKSWAFWKALEMG